MGWVAGGAGYAGRVVGGAGLAAGGTGAGPCAAGGPGRVTGAGFAARAEDAGLATGAGPCAGRAAGGAGEGAACRRDAPCWVKAAGGPQRSDAADGADGAVGASEAEADVRDCPAGLVGPGGEGRRAVGADVPCGTEPAGGAEAGADGAEVAETGGAAEAGPGGTGAEATGAGGVTGRGGVGGFAGGVAGRGGTGARCASVLIRPPADTSSYRPRITAADRPVGARVQVTLRAADGPRGTGLPAGGGSVPIVPLPSRSGSLASCGHDCPRR
ncbi:hypothetical protein WQO_05795 [Streptomyces globisporus C-1027]|uniref:Uncharacterized protein n=1 Tax=Streptomyces globisporus C-1027 TaxID=1172567 RepID=A0A0U3BST1_STRGL|nr:hypothetical protein WQO_05795 [Streptomyces globisporus C-1027]